MSQTRKSGRRSKKTAIRKIERPHSRVVKHTAVTVDKAGRIVLPADIRKSLAIESGDRLTLTVEESGIRLQTRERAIQRAQAMMRKHNPSKVSMVDELIEERRAEAATE